MSASINSHATTATPATTTTTATTHLRLLLLLQPLPRLLWPQRLSNVLQKDLARLAQRGRSAGRSVAEPGPYAARLGNRQLPCAPPPPPPGRRTCRCRGPRRGWTRPRAGRCCSAGEGLMLSCVPAMSLKFRDPPSKHLTNRPCNTASLKKVRLLDEVVPVVSQARAPPQSPTVPEASGTHSHGSVPSSPPSAPTRRTGR